MARDSNSNIAPFPLQARRSGAGGEKEGGFLSAVRSISDIGKREREMKDQLSIEIRPCAVVSCGYGRQEVVRSA